VEPDVAPWAPHAAAMRAYVEGDERATIVVHDDFGERDEHPIAYFFRAPDAFPPIERAAVAACRGRVLDAGAGSGCHALALQDLGLEVCAIDVVPDLVAIMKERGVVDARHADLFDFEGGPFDTVLLLMNGLAPAETLDGLPRLLGALDRLLAQGGQVLADSTDLRSARGAAQREDGRYVGEIVFQLEFGDRKGAPFRQLYVDPDTLGERAAACGWRSEVVARGEGGGYLARLVRAR
jgi:SAM-dependent methyltransferase